MDDMEAKLNALLGNPDMMAQIMSLAQKMGGGESPPPPHETIPPPPPAVPSFPEGLDMGLMMKLAGMAGSATVDGNQKTLLHALRPYLTSERIHKLEKAMRAAKLAGLASSLLGSGLLANQGR